MSSCFISSTVEYPLIKTCVRAHPSSVLSSPLQIIMSFNTSFHHLLQQLLVPGLSPHTQLQCAAASSAASIYAGVGGSHSWISESLSTSFWGGWGSRGLATGMARGLAGIGGIQMKKETMKELNHHLASYLDRVKNLETHNQRLESKIWEHLEKKRPQVRDWAHYFKTIKDLRVQIFANSVDNTRILLLTDNAHLAADDFRVKYEPELAMSQSVKSDSHGFCKVFDDTDVTQLQLDTEIKALKEELLFMKNHEEEVKGL
uniref:IF rod domain-containing protein n=1 Tax=Otolemur garnettii TaxID=30611 RepID=H0XSG2_OTOGA